jgi:hypothetical protein
MQDLIFMILVHMKTLCKYLVQILFYGLFRLLHSQLKEVMESFGKKTNENDIIKTQKKINI